MTAQLPRFCEQCGASLAEGVRFCEECGAPVQALPAAEEQPSISAPVKEPQPQASDAPAQASPGTVTPIAAPAASASADAVTWETNISLLGNPLIRKQLVIVVLASGGFMAFLLSFIVAATGDFYQIPMMFKVSFWTTAGLAALIAFVVLVFFGNRMRVRFTVDETGALWETVDKRAITGNRLALLGAALARSPTAGGAATLAAARQREFVRWSDVVAAEYDQRRRMITLRNSWRPIMLIVCTPENYNRIAADIHSRVVPKSGSETPSTVGPRRHPVLRGLGRTVLVTLAAAPLFILPDFLYSFDFFLPLLTYLFALATVWLIPLFGWVVIGGAAILAIQLAVIGIEEFPYLWSEEQAFFLLAYVGLAVLVWFSWRSVRGKVIPPLLEG
ncbi:MAG: zinc ribbon domain-containing protein [Chloroflexota bacterium]|nr:zinc ribbon domain-containing protein [Chloroflexota bacterium]